MAQLFDDIFRTLCEKNPPCCISATGRPRQIARDAGLLNEYDMSNIIDFTKWSR